MPRYFVEFVNLQRKNGRKVSESPETECPISFTATVKLFSNTLPNTTRAVAKLFSGDGSDGKDSTEPITYRKSQVTRVVAPEYLVQFGEPVRRSQAGVQKLGPLVDAEEFRRCEAKYAGKIRGRRGLVCLAAKGGEATDEADTRSVQLCIVFVPWGEYPELDGYVVVGECKEWAELRRWMAAVDVKENPATGSWEIPTGSGVWVNRCGQILDKPAPHRASSRPEEPGAKRPHRVKAVDLLFKRSRVG